MRKGKEQMCDEVQRLERGRRTDQKSTWQLGWISTPNKVTMMPIKDEEKRKAYHKKHNHVWYEKNKEKIYENNKLRRQEKVDWFATYQKTQKCIMCGFSDFRALEFHHKIPVNDGQNSKLRITYIVHNSGWSTQRLQEYIEQTFDVMCANCHKIHHYELERIS